MKAVENRERSTMATTKTIRRDIKRLKGDLADLDRIYTDLIKDSKKIDVEGALAFFEKRKSIRHKIMENEDILKSSKSHAR